MVLSRTRAARRHRSLAAVISTVLVSGLALVATGAAANSANGAVSGAVSGAAAAPVYEERSATVYDDTGDETSGQPGRDVVEADVRTDPNTGRFTGTITFDAAPSTAANAEYRVYYGTWNADDLCQAEIVVSGNTAAAGRASARPTRLDARGGSDIARVDPTIATSSRQRTGPADVPFGATAKPRIGDEYTCTFIRVVPPGSPDESATVYDDAGAGDLSRAGEPSFFTRGETIRVAKGKTGTLTFTVENLGEVTARQVRVTFSAPKSLRLKKRTATIAAIAPGRTGRVAVPVSMSKVGERSVRAKVTAPFADVDYGYGYVQVSPKPFRSTGSLAGTYQWGNTISTIRGWDIHGVFFVNATYAYRGFPDKGVPTCRKVTAEPGGDGCVRYWFDKQRKRIQVDNERGTFKKGVVSFGGEQYGLDLVSPKKGSRVSADLQFIDSFLCPGFSCVTYGSTLELNRDGTYALGSGESGRYVIGSRGRTVFTTTDGTKKVRTLSLGVRNGKVDIDERGLILGERYWYK